MCIYKAVALNNLFFSLQLARFILTNGLVCAGIQICEGDVEKSFY